MGNGDKQSNAPFKAPSKKSRVGKQPDPKAQQTANKPVKSKWGKGGRVGKEEKNTQGHGAPLTAENGADGGSGTGSTTDPSKKVDRVANAGAQNRSGNTIRPSTIVGSNARG